MTQGNEQVPGRLLSLRRAWAVAIGLLLIVMPVCESLASAQSNDGGAHLWDAHANAHDLHSSTPCHTLTPAPPVQVHSVTVAHPPGPAIASSEHPSVRRGTLDQIAHASYDRNEQWRCDPTLHLVNCVFLN